MIRYYEEIELIKSVTRTMAGYRVYSDKDVNALRFIRRARDLGFTVEQMRDLTALWNDRDRANSDVKRIASGHIDVLENKMRELQEMTRALRHLVDNCHGDGRPDCPIIEELAGTHCDDHAKSRTTSPPGQRFRSAALTWPGSNATHFGPERVIEGMTEV